MIYPHGGHNHAYHPCEESSRDHGAETGSGGGESDVRPAHAHGLCQCQSARKQKVVYEPTIMTVSNEVPWIRSVCLPQSSVNHPVQCACYAAHDKRHRHHGGSHTRQRQTCFCVNHIRSAYRRSDERLTGGLLQFEELECHTGRDAHSCNMPCQYWNFERAGVDESNK